MSEQTLSHDDARELLAAYALGALPAEERVILESLLRDWPEGRAELAQLIQVADSLAVSTAEEMTPPIGLEARIVAAARGDQGASTPRLRIGRIPRQAAAWRRFAPHALAAGFAVVAFVFGVMAFDDDAPTQGVLHRVQSDAAAEMSDIGAYVVYPGSRPLAVFLNNLEAAPAGQMYVLWTVMADGSVQAADSFNPRGPEDTASVFLGFSQDANLIGFAVSLAPLGDLPSEPPPQDAVLLTFPSE